MIADLEEMEYVISVLQALFQWLYLRVVKFDIEDPNKHITAAMELARLADKYNIAGLETETAKYIKEIMIANPHPQTNSFFPPVDINTYWLDREHIISATYLRREHPVRQTLAAASVAGYLQSDKHKFLKETQEYPSFAADLLLEVRSTLDRPNSNLVGTFEDPISGKILELEVGLLLSLFSLLPPLFFLFAPLFCLQKQSLVIWGFVVGHRSVRGEVARGNWEGLDRWVP